MSNAFDRQANRAGIISENRCRGTLYTDPMTGATFFDGRRSRHSFQHERRRERFLRQARQRRGI